MLMRQFASTWTPTSYRGKGGDTFCFGKHRSPSCSRMVPRPTSMVTFDVRTGRFSAEAFGPSRAGRQAVCRRVNFDRTGWTRRRYLTTMWVNTALTSSCC